MDEYISLGTSANDPLWVDMPPLPASLQQGLSLPLMEVLQQENIPFDAREAGVVAMTVLDLVVGCWTRSGFTGNGETIARLRGFDEPPAIAYWQGEAMPIEVLRHIDQMSRFALSLQKADGSSYFT